MWTRDLLKTRAKEVLRIRYWTVFLGCFIAGILGGVSGGGSSSGILSNSSNLINSSLGNIPTRIAVTVSVVFFIVALMAFVISLVLTIFVGNVITVGLRRFAMEARTSSPGLNVIFWGFWGGRYMKIVKTMFFYTLHIALWTMLFIVPGIIRGYQYYFVPYILPENPDIDSYKILEMSNQMTNGDKGGIFGLNLSFIGWNLLGMLTCCIGSIFLTPYVVSTDAELYAVVRERSIYNHMADTEALTGFSTTL